MLPKIKTFMTNPDYTLSVSFDDGKKVLYDMADDIKKLPHYSDLQNITGLFYQARLDKSRTCLYWNDYIDLPSDMIYEYGK